MGKDATYSEKAYASFTKSQIRAIDGLIGTFGTNRSDVVRTITICWLEGKGLLAGINKKSAGDK